MRGMGQAFSFVLSDGSDCSWGLTGQVACVRHSELWFSEETSLESIQQFKHLQVVAMRGGYHQVGVGDVAIAVHTVLGPWHAAFRHCPRPAKHTYATCSLVMPQSF